MLAASFGWFGKVYTSTYVFDETLTLTKSKIGGEKAINLAQYILDSERIRILTIDEKVQQDREKKKLGRGLVDSFEIFKKNHEMRGLSFTDCTTLFLLSRMKLKCILSFDSNFRPFVPRILGEGYGETLSSDENIILAKAAEKLGIKL
jgi:predicted nucleic acid-binding protein